MSLVGFFNGQEINLQIDPGASRSFISLELAKKMKLKLENTDETMNVQIADGNFVNSNQYTDIKFKIEQLFNIEFKERFYVLPGSLRICLLEQTFLQATEAQIDYREGRLRFNEHYIFTDKNIEDWSKTPEKDLIEKEFLTINKE